MMKVMIAEDDLFVADMLAQALVDGGYDVCGVARTVDEAIELGERYKPDLAILDIRLANGGLGTDIPARLGRQRHMGVLYASGQVGHTVLTSADGDGLLVKPYRTEDAIRSLRIVEQILSNREGPHECPRGFSVLAGPPKTDAEPVTAGAETAKSDRRIRLQMEGLARFGTFALRERDIAKVMAEATTICAECMEVAYSAIYQYRPTENDLLLTAGTGWDEGLIGRVVSRADASSPHGLAFITNAPVVCSELCNRASFVQPRFYVEHGVVATLDVSIGNVYQPYGIRYGVLEIASPTLRDYDHHDTDFLIGITNILAEAVYAKKRNEELFNAVDKLQNMVDDRDRFNAANRAILEDKTRLVDTQISLVGDVQHRVRAHLQLVYAVLTQQVQSMTDSVAKDAIRALARRILVFAQVYDHRLNDQLGRKVDFVRYLSALCINFESLDGRRIEFPYHSDPIVLDSDSITNLGLAVSELISDIHCHTPSDAASDPMETISVLLCPEPSGHDAALTVSYEGKVFSTDTSGSDQHGFGLVSRLLEQIGGSVTYRSSDHGADWTLAFPVPTNP